MKKCATIEPIQRNHTSSPEIVKKMDACSILSSEICDLVYKRMENIDKTFNSRLEKERVRLQSDKREYGSVFGSTNTETVVSQPLKGSDDQVSVISGSSSKRADAEAELASKVEPAKAIQMLHAQQAKLDKMETEWKLKEAEMLIEIKQREAEMKLKLEEGKSKSQQLQADSEVKVAEARVRAYNNFDIFGSCDEETDKVPLDSPNTEYKPCLNPQAAPFEPQPAAPQKSTHEDASVAQETTVTQALTSSFTLSCLPVPELTTFTGDPLKFIDWKVFFMALIDQKPLPVSEKMLYLKSYLAGEARKAMEGFFYHNSEDAYRGAWAVLEDRYGSLFIVQRAFRVRLLKWPKIAANDPRALREFADFLLGCAEAMPHVKGLSILNDCEENHKILNKLPEWMVHRWNRIVIEELDRSGDYPSFLHFTEFMQKEARVACNPIASPLMINMKTSDQRSPKKAKTLNTSTQIKGFNSTTSESSKPRPPCLVCRNDAHGVAKCPVFATKTMDEKRAFIHEHRLCFGCLQKGHVAKYCKR